MHVHQLMHVQIGYITDRLHTFGHRAVCCSNRNMIPWTGSFGIQVFCFCLALFFFLFSFSFSAPPVPCMLNLNEKPEVAEDALTSIFFSVQCSLVLHRPTIPVFSTRLTGITLTSLFSVHG